MRVGGECDIFRVAYSWLFWYKWCRAIRLLLVPLLCLNLRRFYVKLLKTMIRSNYEALAELCIKSAHIFAS